MKKFLSLVLALVMTMSLVTISAGAKDFDDNGDIDYKEAVDVISALGIVDGYSDGSFRPDGSLTRGAAAKIICNLILGPTTASALSASTAPFKDVPTTNTFAGYITYCAQQGIISGYGDGTFRPTGTLTGNAFMKMLLGALGYDSSIEGYTGSNWQVSVIKQAAGIGLDDGNDDFVGSRTVTRQEAALYSFNMLKATMVDYDSKSTIVVGGVEVSTIPARFEVTNTSTRTDGNIKDDGLMQFAEMYFTSLKGTDSQDDFNRPATEWRYNNRAIGTYTKEADETYTAKVKLTDVYSDLGLSESTKATEQYVDGKEVTEQTLVRRDSNNTKVTDSGNGVLTQVWYEEDERGNVEYLIISAVNTYVAEVSAINNRNDEDRSITLSPKSTPDGGISSPGTLADSGRFETQDFARNDLVTYTAAWNGSRYEIQTVEALTDYETGTLTEWNGKSYDTSDQNTKGRNDFTVGGTTYDYSANFAAEDEDGDPIDLWDFDVDESELNVYCDQYGYAIFVSGVEGTKNYAAVIGVGTTNPYGDETDGVTLLLPDGSTTRVDAKLDRGMSSGNKVDEPKGDLVSYKVNDDDVYELTLLEDADGNKTGIYDDGNLAGTNQAEFENGRSLLVLDNHSYYTTNDTIFMVATGPDSDGDWDYDVYIGYDAMPSIDETDGINGYAISVDDNNRVDIVYIAAPNLAGINTVDTYFVKESGAKITHNSNGDYYTLPAVVDGEETDVRISADIRVTTTKGTVDFSDNDVEGVFAINNVKVDSNNIITDFDIVGGTYGAQAGDNVFNAEDNTSGTKSASRGLLGFANGHYYAYNDDTMVYYVDKDFKDIMVSSVDAVNDDANDLVYASYDDDDRVLVDVVIVEVDDDKTPEDPEIDTTDGDKEGYKLNVATQTIDVVDRVDDGQTVNEIVTEAMERNGFEVRSIVGDGAGAIVYVIAPNGEPESWKIGTLTSLYGIDVSITNSNIRLVSPSTVWVAEGGDVEVVIQNTEADFGSATYTSCTEVATDCTAEVASNTATRDSEDLSIATLTLNLTTMATDKTSGSVAITIA